MIRLLFIICFLFPMYLWSASATSSTSTPIDPSAPMCDCTVSQGEDSFPLPFISGNQSAIDFYAYGTPIGSSSNTGLETSNGMIMMLYEDLISGETSLIIILDSANDGSGGEVNINFNCLPSDAFVMLSDDSGELTGTPPNIVGDFFWSPCCTDGGIIGGIGCGNTVTIDPDIISGIDFFALAFGEASSADLITLPSSDCPITIDCGGTSCCEESFEFEAVTQDATCSAGSDGSIDLTTTCSVNPSFEWSNGETTEDLSNLTAGVYSVTITDDSGCSLSDSYTVGINELVLDVTGLAEDVGCMNNMDGTITTTVSNSTSTPFSFIWSNGETSQDLLDLDVGNYLVTVTDANGCTGTQEFVITEPEELVGAIVNVVQPVEPVIYGTAGTTISGGSPGYTYLWDNGESTPVASNLAPGIHNVTITDIKGCEIILTVEIYEQFTVGTAVNEEFCNSECAGSINLQPTGGLPPYEYSWSNGATTPVLTNLCAGIYICDIMDSYGSFFQVSVIINPFPDIYLNTDFSTTICDTTAVGYIDLSITGGTMPYSFFWSNGSFSEDLTQLSSGTYEVTVSDFNNCTIEDSFTILESPSFSFESNITAADCGQNNGGILLDNFQGQAPYEYFWSSGEFTESISNKPAGTYEVTITDNEGCSQTHSFTIPSSQGATLDFEVNHVSCEGEMDGSISVDIINGTPPYTFEWSSGQSSSYIENLPPGDYTVTVTDSLNCTYSSSFNLAISSFITINPSVFDESCSGLVDGELHIEVLEGFAPYQYIWSNGMTEPIVDSLASGQYQLDLIDSLGCLYSFEYEIQEGNSVTFIDTIINNLCANQFNGSIQVEAIGNEPFTFEWDNASTDSIITDLPYGIFTITATDIDGCAFEKQFQLIDPPALSNVFDVIQPGCNEDTLGTATAITSGGTGNFEVLWSNGQMTNTITELESGLFTVTITDNNSCTLVDSIAIIESEPVQAIAIVDSITCYGDFASIQLITLSGIEPFQFLWDDGNTEQIRDDLTAGFHSVEISDDIGCFRDLSFFLSQPDKLTSIFSQSIPPTSIGGDGLLQIDIVGGTPPYAIEWSNGSVDVLVIENLDYGTYSYTIVDGNGCVNSGQIVFEPLPLSSNIGVSANQCFDQCNGSIELEILGGAMPYSFLWSNGSSNSTIDELCNGSYSVTVTDDLSATLIYNDILIQSPALLSSMNITTDVSCIGANDGSIFIDAFGGTPPYDYIFDGNSSSNLITDLEEGEYMYEVVDSFGCLNSEMVTIMGVSPLDLDVVTQNIDCNFTNGGIIITSDNINNYDILINGNSYGADDIILAENLNIGTYTIQYQINEECIQDVGEVDIVDEELFEVSFDPDLININLGEDFSLNIIISDTSNLIQTIDWFSNAVVTCEEFNQENFCVLLEGNTSENEFIRISVELKNGCLYEYLIPIEVDISTDIYLPNIFSPNGDGINDVFSFSSNIPIVEINSFSIYDRWGNQMFNQSNVDPLSFEGWNGKFKGQYVKPGVYVYSFSIQLLEGEVKQFVGDLTVTK